MASYGKAVTGTAVMARSAYEEKKNSRTPRRDTDPLFSTLIPESHPLGYNKLVFTCRCPGTTPLRPPGIAADPTSALSLSMDHRDIRDYNPPDPDIAKGKGKDKGKPADKGKGKGKKGQGKGPGKGKGIFFFCCIAELAIKPCRSSRSKLRGEFEIPNTCKTGNKNTTKQQTPPNPKHNTKQNTGKCLECETRGEKRVKRSKRSNALICRTLWRKHEVSIVQFIRDDVDIP